LASRTLQYMDEKLRPRPRLAHQTACILRTSPTPTSCCTTPVAHPQGCRIAAIKAGSSERGSRAASLAHGTIASSDSAVEPSSARPASCAASRARSSPPWLHFHPAHPQRARTSPS
jgi:hypothetical protein